MTSLPFSRTFHISHTSASTEKERLSGLLEEVGKRDGIEGLRLSHEGTAALNLTSGKKVYFEYQENAAALVLYMPLFDLPRDPKRRLACMEQMLDRNFLKLKTGRGELSLMRESDQAVYQIVLQAAGLNVDLLDDSINEMLEQYEASVSVLKSPISNALPHPFSSGHHGGRQQLLANVKRR
jgi:hypothetical protein